MGLEKEKNGGYVGGFFQLFDWTAKSRKKLFSSKSDLPERSKQGKRRDGNLPRTRLNLMDEDEYAVGSSVRDYSDYSCASSVTDDDGFGARAPSVVARLMGLDSMPLSNFAEPNNTPFSDTQSLRGTSQRRNHFECYHDPQIMISGNLLNKEIGPPGSAVEPKPTKVLIRPLEKFQTEILPPKSAKSIPITHHKLLSPIKSPGFIPSKTAAHIMEAAARIIEPGPQTSRKAKIPMVGSSSVPLKVRDLKEKLEGTQRVPLVGSSLVPPKSRDLKEKTEAPYKTSRLAEASQRPVESNAAKYLKGQSMNKSWNGSIDTTSCRALPEVEESSSSSKNQGKSISLAIQAKVNVQRRESLNSSTSRGLGSQKEQCEVMSSQTFRSKPNTQKTLPKKSVHNGGGVLKQNNQKQNCLLDKSGKSAISNSQSRKVASGNHSARHKTSGKTIGSKNGTRKLGSDTTDSEKALSSCGTKNIPRKKRSIDGTLQVEKNQVVDNVLIDNNQDSELSKTNDRHFSRAEESKRKGMDVVSFTFTAPLTRSMPGYETSGQLTQKNSVACMDNRGKRLLLDSDSMKLSSVGYNVIGGDALSNLLEQKLRELTNSMEFSSRNSVKIGSALGSSSFSEDSTPALRSDRTTLKLHDTKSQNMLLVDKSCGSNDSDVFSPDSASIRFKHLFQGVNEMEECSSNSIDSRKLLDRRRPSPVSVLEPSFSTESSSSLESMDCSSAEASKQCSSVQGQEVFGFSSLKKFYYSDGDVDLSDSASSTSNGITAKKHEDNVMMQSLEKSIKWETDYIHSIMYNLEYMFEEYALGHACEIVNPLLFNQLEKSKDLCNESVEVRLERKAIFDWVSECLETRYSRYANGGYEAWKKGVMAMRRKKHLAEEVMKEVSTWRGMGDCNVDELVDKDMSSQYGKWLDFEVDAFTLVTEIEGQICSTLVDEVVVDIFQR